MTSTTIARVRLMTGADDRLAAQMRCQSALRPLDLQPPGMPSRAILCIRSMQDPLPGGLDLRSPHAPRATQWEMAARNAIRGALSRAVRVAGGFVPLHADAVLFDDRAELLACAAQDAAAGENRWWWRSLVRGMTTDDVRREWLRQPEYIAAALDVLDARFDALPFIRALAPHEAIELLVAALRAHALETFASEVIRAMTTPPAAAPDSWGRSTSIPPPPWTRVAPALRDEAALPIEPRLFAGVALALRRAPARVREARFAREVAAWIVTVRASESAAASPIATAPHVIDEVQPARPPHAENAIPPATPHAHSSSAPIDDAAPARSGAPISHESRDEPQRATSPSPHPDAPQPAIPAMAPIRSRQESAPLPIPIEGITIDSGYAGVFFLLGAAIALGIYDPYGRRALAFDVWRFLSLTAHALLDDIDEDDPLWALFGALAGTEEARKPRRLRTFLLFTLIFRTRRFVAKALDAPEPARFLLRRYGRVVVTPAHVDVHFSLAAHPIEIRLSGLDRDPGWIPAAGRHVAFHFD
ncbi:MAG TPA: hypothetical protein VFO89_11495 [Thermoanaerobaculia bacterium]|nr:hypothetical protein [Thermoanaerobaculia bacterium]